MRRIGLAVVLGLAIVTPLAKAQQTEKVWRIGILSMAPAAETAVFDAFLLLHRVNTEAIREKQ